MKIRIYILIVLLGLGLYSCYEIQTYPPTPSIEFIEFYTTDSSDILGNTIYYGELRFSFVDGDGDLGYQETTDTSLTEEQKTIFITEYKMEDGEFREIEQAIPLTYRMEYFETSGNNKTLKGEIRIQDLNHYASSLNDSIKYNFYIKDRAGNISNTAETDTIIFN